MPSDVPIAFFSYCRDDSEFALKLAEDLKAAGTHGWLDQLELEPGEPWDIAIKQALLACPRMLVILSPASVTSRNVLDEVIYALRNQKTVIPLLYLACDIPLQLERLHQIDFRTDYAGGLRSLLRALHPPPQERPEPMSVFYSYSHKDEGLRLELEAHLAAMRSSGLIREWHDRKIVAGDGWDKEINRYLDSAQLILFLLSSDFVNSGYIMDVEVKRALERQRAGEAVVVPVILRPVVWGMIPQFRDLQPLPKDGVPVTAWPSRDLAYVSVCEGILALVFKRHEPITRRSAPRSHSRRRLVDAAIPSRVPIAKPSALLVMIRRADSPGLRGIVEAEPIYGMSKEDINTNPVTLRFPVDQGGISQPLDIVVKVESPEFEPKSQSKTIKVSPKGDSEARVFLLTPTKLGPLLVNLEVSLGGNVITGCMLRTFGEPTEQTSDPTPQVVTSAPLTLSDLEDEPAELEAILSEGRLAAAQARLEEERQRAAAEKARLEQLERERQAAEEKARQDELVRQRVATEQARPEQERQPPPVMPSPVPPRLPIWMKGCMALGALLVVGWLLYWVMSKPKVVIANDIRDETGVVVDRTKAPFKILVTGTARNPRAAFVYLVVANGNAQYIEPRGNLGYGVEGPFSGYCYLGIQGDSESLNRVYRVFAVVTDRAYKEFDPLEQASVLARSNELSLTRTR